MSASNNVPELIIARQQVCDQICKTHSDEYEFLNQVAMKRATLKKQLLDIENKLRVYCEHEWVDSCEEDYYRNYYCSKCGISQESNN